MSDIDARPEGCVFRTMTAAGSSAFMGGVLGAVSTTWSVRRRGSRTACTLLLHVARARCACAATRLRPARRQDVPKVLKGKALPALLATGRVMGAYSVTFAAIGGLFAAVDVRARAAARRACTCRNPSGQGARALLGAADARAARAVPGGGRARQEGLLERRAGRRCCRRRPGRARCAPLALALRMRSRAHAHTHATRALRSRRAATQPRRCRWAWAPRRR
jgi:hypothetical protein